MIIDGNGNTHTVAGNLDFTVTSTEIEVVVSGESEGTVTADDLQYATVTDAVTDTEAVLEAESGLVNTPTFVALNPSVATVDASGRVSRVSDGTARIKCRVGKQAQVKSVAVSRRGGQTSQEFVGWANGSLAKHITDAMEAAAATGTKPIYTSQGHVAAAYVRSSELWLSSVDLTAVSPWNSTGGNRRAGVAVTDKHIIMANHYAVSNGSTVRFVTADNQVVDRTLVASAQIGNTDIRLGRLSSVLPDSISPMKVLPATYADYLPTVSKANPLLYRVPCCAVDQEEKLLASSVRQLSSTSAMVIAPNTEDLLNLYETVIKGDSGNPVFFVINGEPVLLFTFFYAISGPFVSNYITEINTQLDTYDSGYSLSTVNLSEFTDYS